jgi:hypothetical protein
LTINKIIVLPAHSHFADNNLTCLLTILMEMIAAGGASSTKKDGRRSLPAEVDRVLSEEQRRAIVQLPEKRRVPIVEELTQLVAQAQLESDERGDGAEVKKILRLAMNQFAELIIKGEGNVCFLIQYFFPHK